MSVHCGPHVSKENLFFCLDFGNPTYDSKELINDLPFSINGGSVTTGTNGYYTASSNEFDSLPPLPTAPGLRICSIDTHSAVFNISTTYFRARINSGGFVTGYQLLFRKQKEIIPSRLLIKRCLGFPKGIPLTP